MASSISSIGLIESALKLFYVGKIVEQINQETLLLDHFSKGTIEWAGKSAIVPLHTQRNESVGAYAEGQTQDPAGQQGYKNLTMASAYIYGNFGFTGPAQAAAAKSAGAFDNIVGLEMKPLVKDVRNYSDICLFTGGIVFGYLWQKGQLNTWQSSVRTSYPQGVTPAGAVASVINLRTFENCGSATVVSVVAGTVVVSASGNTIDTRLTTGGGAHDVIDGDVFVWQSAGTGAASRLAVEPVGMAGNFGLPSWFGIQRGTVGTETLQGEFQLANPSTNVADDLTQNNLTNLSAKIEQNYGEMPDEIFMSPLMIASYSSLLQGVQSGLTATAARQDVKSPASRGDIGFTGYDWAGIRIFKGKNCPLNVIYMLSREHWKIAELKAGDFVKTGGDVLTRVPNTDTYVGMYSWYYQLYTDRPNASGVLAGVSIPV